MRSDSDDADAPAGVLDHGQDIGLGAIEQVRREEVAGQDRLSLGAQEQRPGRTGPPRRAIDTGLLQDAGMNRAVPVMEVGPPGSPCRRGAQTTASCAG
jgi:hypothetical protein